MTFTLWALTQNPDAMARLRAELDDKIPDPAVFPDNGAIMALPYLSAVVKEGTSAALDRRSI